jgi:hypothetical protein
VALKFLVPVARQRLVDCQRMAAILRQAFTAIRAEPANWMPRGAKVHLRSANAFSMIPSCFSKRSVRRMGKSPAGAGAELLRDLEMVMKRA